MPSECCCKVLKFLFVRFVLNRQALWHFYCFFFLFFFFIRKTCKASVSIYRYSFRGWSLPSYYRCCYLFRMRCSWQKVRWHNIILKHLFFEGALHMKWQITTEARSNELFILYPARPSRIIVSLKTPGSKTFPNWFYSGPKRYMSAIFSRAAKIFSGRSIADAFLDHSRCNRYMNW